MSETENKNRFKIERISFRKKIERQKRENGRRRERLFVFEKIFSEKGTLLEFIFLMRIHLTAIRFLKKYALSAWVYKRRDI